MKPLFFLLALSFVSLACGDEASNSPEVFGSSGASGSTAAAGGSAGQGGVAGGGGGGGMAGAAGANTDVGKCVAEAQFGDKLPAGFARVDGTLVAIVRPVDTQCAFPNDDHVTLQIQVDGAIYRMVVNVVSTLAGDKRVRLGKHDAPLPAPAWAEGFHTGLTLDYPKDLGVHIDNGEFTPFEMTPLVDEIVGSLAIGQHVSVYAQGSGGISAHKVHRNGKNDDGAIVVSPDGPSPRFLLFHFSTQSF